MRLCGTDPFLSGIGEVLFSPDSKRVAYGASRGDKYLVVVDGVEQKEYQDLGPGTLVFSPDSKHLAYVARQSGSMFVVVDGEEGRRYETFLQGSKLVFDTSTSLYGIAMNGNNFVRVNASIATEAITKQTQPAGESKELLENRATLPTAKVKTHNDSVYGYTVSYPSSWQPPPEEWLPIIKQSEQKVSRQLLFMAVSPDQKLNLQIDVSNESPQKGEPLQRLLERLLKTSPLSIANATTNIIDIAGVKAIRFDSDTTAPGGFPARYAKLLLVRNGHAWLVGIGGNKTSFQQNQAEIEAILNSIKFGSQ